MTDQELIDVVNRATFADNAYMGHEFREGGSFLLDVVRDDVPKIVSEVMRLRKALEDVRAVYVEDPPEEVDGDRLSEAEGLACQLEDICIIVDKALA